MKDRIAGAPGRYSAVVTGGEYQKLLMGQPFTITLTRDDKPEVEGTPYSKAAVLPDEVAHLICPDIEDPTPADAFRGLGKRMSTVADYIVEQGSDNIWTWRKWASGIAELWGSITEEIRSSSDDGYLVLPIIIWNRRISNWPYPVVNYSVKGDDLISTTGVHRTYEFECNIDTDPETGLEIVTQTKLRIPMLSFFEIHDDGMLYPVSPYYSVDVYMVGRWKPLDDTTVAEQEE